MFKKPKANTPVATQTIINPLNLKAHFHKNAIYFPKAGILAVNEYIVTKGKLGSVAHDNIKYINFALTGAFSDLPWLTSGMVHFIFEEAKAQGYQPVALISYKDRDFHRESENVSPAITDVFTCDPEAEVASIVDGVTVRARNFTLQESQVLKLNLNSLYEELPLLTPATADAIFDCVEAAGLECLEIISYQVDKKPTHSLSKPHLDNTAAAVVDYDMPAVIRHRRDFKVQEAEETHA